MSLATGRYQIASSMKALTVRWDVTCMSWRDAVRRDFTTRYWNMLEGQLPQLLAAIDRLDQQIAQARQECSSS
jgi:hypothetical protein